MKKEELIVKIEKIVPNGYGLAFAEGLTVFTSLAVSGDILRVRIREKKGKTAFGEIVEIIEPSAHRIKPPCSYFGRCGGCNFQQMNYAEQLRAKTEIIRDCLKRIAGINLENEIPIFSSPQEFGYRTRAQWHADTVNKKIGYYKRFSNQITDIENCLVLDQALQDKLTDLRLRLDWSQFWAQKVEIEAATNGREVSLYSDELIEPTDKIALEVLENRYLFAADSFFQGNQSLIAPLIKTAIAGAKGKNALDLYCGVGLFSLPLAKRFKKVVGVEANQQAVELARENAELASLDNIDFHTENTSEWLTENNPEEVDFILLDPPRSGTEKATIEQLIKISPEQISYVSCDPATLARDLRILQDYYQISSLTALDLFPQTHHVETVVRLKKIVSK